MTDIITSEQIKKLSDEISNDVININEKTELLKSLINQIGLTSSTSIDPRYYDLKPTQTVIPVTGGYLPVYDYTRIKFDIDETSPKVIGGDNTMHTDISWYPPIFIPRDKSIETNLWTITPQPPEGITFDPAIGHLSGTVNQLGRFPLVIHHPDLAKDINIELLFREYFNLGAYVSSLTLSSVDESGGAGRNYSFTVSGDTSLLPADPVFEHMTIKMSDVDTGYQTFASSAKGPDEVSATLINITTKICDVDNDTLANNPIVSGSLVAADTSVKPAVEITIYYNGVGYTTHLHI